MATAEIITGQYVHITQTPAGVADRVIGRMIDMFVIFLYVFSVIFVFYRWLDGLPNALLVTLWIGLLLPAVFYTFLLETFFHGQTAGKRIMKTRVVRADGSMPSVGDFFMRWILLLVDLHVSCIGIIFIICTARNQRLGDMAAGTMVVKSEGYKKLSVSLDEFDYARRDYRPVYPEAAQLSLGQVDVIRKTLYGPGRYDENQAARLAAKVQAVLNIRKKETDDYAFLETLLHDYHHYALELV